MTPKPHFSLEDIPILDTFTIYNRSKLEINLPKLESQLIENAISRNVMMRRRPFVGCVVGSCSINTGSSKTSKINHHTRSLFVFLLWPTNEIDCTYKEKLLRLGYCVNPLLTAIR